MKYIIAIFIIFIQGASIAQPCPKYGNSTTAAKKKLNTLKNAGVNVNSSRIPESLPLKNLITTKKRKDRN